MSLAGKKVTIEVEERNLTAREYKDVSVNRVLRPLGNADDYFIRYKGTILPVRTFDNNRFSAVYFC